MNFHVNPDFALYARSFGPEAAAFSGPGDSEALASYGFAQTAGAPLVKSTGSAWTIAPPADAQTFTRALTGQGWVPAAPSGAALAPVFFYRCCSRKKGVK